MIKYMTRVLTASGMTLLAGIPLPAGAGALSIAGQGQLNTGYDDNIRLVSHDPVTASNASADVSANLLYQNDVLLWRFTPRLFAVRYRGQSGLDRTEPHVSMLTQYNEARSSVSLLLTGVQDSTLTSELGLTGLAEVNKKHRAVTATLSNQWQLNERLVMSTQLYATDSAYIDAERTGLVDYRYGVASFSGRYGLTERSSLSLQSSISKLQVPDLTAYDKTSTNVTLGYGLQLSPRWRADVSAGPSRVRTETRVDHGSVYELSVTRDAQRAAFSISAGRDVTPTGRGLLARRDQLQLSMSQSLSERWFSSAAITTSRNVNLLTGSGVTRDEVAYGDVSATLGWRITPQWQALLSGGYSRQRLDNHDDAAERRHIALSISWNGLMHRLD